MRTGDGHSSTNRGIAAPAVTPDAGHLKSGLIERNIVCLSGVGAGIVSRNGNIDRIIQRERFVNHAAVEVSVPAAAGVVSPACDQAGVNPVMVGDMRRPGGGHTSTNRGIVTGPPPPPPPPPPPIWDAP